jgi:ribosomal protein S18 acetylase RimI-like enzyme
MMTRPYSRSSIAPRNCAPFARNSSTVDPVYKDHELFADFLTTYYTDHEPESSFVLELEGEICGYLLGSRRPLFNQLYAFQQNLVLGFRALLRYRRYNDRSRRFVRWVLSHGWREVPAAPRRTPHFHINLLPEARKMSTTRALMSAYLSYLYRCGERQVFGQIVPFESRRGERMFERYGFRVMNRAEITKYKAFYPESVYLSTVIKNLETAEPLSVSNR